MTTNTPQVPNLQKMGKIQKLCTLKNPYQETEATNLLFVQGMKESIAWHSEHNQFYRRLLALRNFSAEQLNCVEDCAQVPFVVANFFKAHEELSVPREKITVHLTSSGTSGQKSQIFFDDWSLGAPQQMIDFIFEDNGWISKTPANYLLYSYQAEPDPALSSNLGTAYTDNFLCKYAPVARVFYALRLTATGQQIDSDNASTDKGGEDTISANKNNHEFDLFGCIEKLVQFAEEGKPVRIFGFPAFLHFTLARMKELHMPPLKLAPESLVFLGGGWKGHADKAIDKLELYKSVTEQLGIPDSRVRDGFGSVEHCIPYIECEHHQFHVPVWSKVFVRDVKTLAPVPYGEKGFLHLVSPYITSVPACSVLMGDLASLHPADNCPCPIQTPYFVVHGRAGLSKNKSCAVAAAELLGKERKH